MTQIGRGALALGYAGLLPQVAAVAVIAPGVRGSTGQVLIPAVIGYALALVYGAVILSFLGGIWWGWAMARSVGQARLAAIAVLPSLVGVACLAAGGLFPLTGWPAVALGSALMLTLLVDRHLVATGEAPADWMRLRTPLSLGLGGLTIAAGVLVGSA